MVGVAHSPPSLYGDICTIAVCVVCSVSSASCLRFNGRVQVLCLKINKHTVGRKIRFPYSFVVYHS